MSSIRSRGVAVRSFTVRNRRRTRSCFRPVLTVLEDRWLLNTFVVQNLNDSGTDLLRANIAQAQNGDTIKFAKGLTGTITLTSGSLVVSTGLDINGPGAGKLTISGDEASGVFFIPSRSGKPMPPPKAVSASGITDSGSGSHDPGLFNLDATKTQDSLTASANQGGRITSLATMTLKSPEIPGNTASFFGAHGQTMRP